MRLTKTLWLGIVQCFRLVQDQSGTYVDDADQQLQQYGLAW